MFHNGVIINFFCKVIIIVIFNIILLNLNYHDTKFYNILYHRERWQCEAEVTCNGYVTAAIASTMTLYCISIRRKCFLLNLYSFLFFT